MEEKFKKFWESIYEEGENYKVEAINKNSFLLNSESPFENTKLKINCIRMGRFEYQLFFWNITGKYTYILFSEMAIWIDD